MAARRTVAGLTLAPLLAVVLWAGGADGEPVLDAPEVTLDPPADAALDPAAPEPVDAAVLAAALGPLVGDPALGPSPGVSVRDLATGAEVVQRGSAEPVEPASSLKLLTAAAALEVLGAEHRSVTRVGWVPAGQRPGGRPAVVLVGGGDLLLAAGEGDPTAVDGRVGLADLARSAVLALAEGGEAARLLAPGTTEVDVVVDDSLLGAPQALPGRSAGDAFFASPPASLAVAAGRRGAGEGRDGDPAGTAGDAFASALGAALTDVLGAGAPQVGTVDVVTEPVATPVALAEGRSADLVDVLALLLVTSDNTLADGVAGLVAAERGAGPGLATAGAEVAAVVAGLGVALGPTRLVDGSGLSDGSVTTAAALSGLLAVAAAAPDDSDLVLLPQLLPVAGLEGTLAGRFERGTLQAPGRGVVRAKTGTLTGTTSLSGVVTSADGRGLAFAVLTDEVPATDTVAARVAADRIAAAVAACC
ncbi:D-alanyl-D-alanine carboxypeptidase [Aquipuribacter sp. SD81]|uniref:D-alanyl-D-alanine carboxypeptidase n=1 Tax=Aquipuribacter sp. SD81 TaxID=3127703 RepID=UPI003017CD4E